MVGKVEVREQAANHTRAVEQGPEDGKEAPLVRPVRVLEHQPSLRCPQQRRANAQHAAAQNDHSAAPRRADDREEERGGDERRVAERAEEEGEPRTECVCDCGCDEAGEREGCVERRLHLGRERLAIQLRGESLNGAVSCEYEEEDDSEDRDLAGRRAEPHLSRPDGGV